MFSFSQERLDFNSAMLVTGICCGGGFFCGITISNALVRRCAVVAPSLRAWHMVWLASNVTLFEGLTSLFVWRCRWIFAAPRKISGRQPNV